MTDTKKTVARIKTGQAERRLSLAKSGAVAGARFAGHSMMNMFYGKEQRQQRNKNMLSKQANYFVQQLGELKGSIVKVGQMMALYGENFLPTEVVEALHTLEDQTVAVDWSVMEPMVRQQLGADYDLFTIDTTPVGAASLAQVHKAIRKADGVELAFKIQYPGIRDAIDTDIDALVTMMKVARMIPKGIDFASWVDELREMLYQEVDYNRERQNTELFYQRYADDERLVVAKTYPEYSSDALMVTSFEAGVGVTDPTVLALPVARRDRLAKAGLDAFFREFFVWGDVQTDPNFGNFKIRIGATAEEDKLILLDFGAVRTFSQPFLAAYQTLIKGAWSHEADLIAAGAKGMGLMRPDTSQQALDEFAQLCFFVIEPFADWTQYPPPANCLSSNGGYLWHQSDLPARVAKTGASAAISRDFHLPPQEFVFLNRKLIGMYMFIAALQAEFHARELLGDYL